MINDIKEYDDQCDLNDECITKMKQMWSKKRREVINF